MQRDTHSRWDGKYTKFLRMFKREVRDNFATGSQYTIHGTQSKMEAMVDIRSLFGEGKYEQLTDLAVSGSKWDGRVTRHDEPVCPEYREHLCKELFAANPGLEAFQHRR
eukprot:scaffold91676_cov37-Prasinocladus_malaysianus.AAC.1